jgi:hypothetical protein
VEIYLLLEWMGRYMIGGQANLLGRAYLHPAQRRECEGFTTDDQFNGQVHDILFVAAVAGSVGDDKRPRRGCKTCLFACFAYFAVHVSRWTILDEAGSRALGTEGLGHPTRSSDRVGTAPSG